MRSTLLLVILLTTFLTCFAQTLTTNEIDSVHEVTSQMLRRNNSDSVLDMTYQTYKDSEAIGYEYGLARSLTLRGFYYRNKYSLDSAEQLFNRAKRVYEENDFFGDSIKSKYSMIFMGLGNVYRSKRRFDLAEEYLNKALSMFKKEGDQGRSYSVLISLGIIQGMQSKYADALEYFLEAYEFALSQDFSTSVVSGNIGVCYYRMGITDKAIEFMKRGLAEDIRKGDKHPQIAKYNNLGDIYSDLNLLDSANYFTNQAYELAKEFGNYKSATIALSNMAQRFIVLERYNLAEQLMNEALEIADSVGLPNMEEKFHMVKSDIFNRRGENDSAKVYALRAFDLTKNASNTRYAATMAKRLSIYYEAENLLDSALLYFKQYHSLKDSLFNKVNQRKFTELYSRIDNIEKQRQIELLQKQKEIDEQKRRNLVVSIIFTIAFAFTSIATLIYRHKNKQKRQRIKQIELQSEVEKREAELQQQTLHMINMNNGMKEVEENLRSLKKNQVITPKDIQRTLSNITVNKSMEKEWDRFESYFSKIHSKFNISLSQRHANLTQTERRLTALIKMDLSNREIANILNVEQRSVIMGRYRLKKKFKLDEEQDLVNYIHTL